MRFRLLPHILFLLLTMAPAGMRSVHAAEGQLAEESRVIGSVTIPGGSVSGNAYKKFDQLVPRLRKIPANAIVWLECRFRGSSDREGDVLKAYYTAANVEKYLRERHRLKLDIWISAIVDSASLERNKPSVTISILSDDIRKLDQLPVRPANANAD